jgi:hypothetical protein
MIRNGNHAHYEQSMESVLRRSKANYIGTDERKMGLLKNGNKLKNFDIILNTKGRRTYLIDFKGKKFGYQSSPSNKWENWIPEKHARDLIEWQIIFKESKCKVTPLLVFLFLISTKIDKEHFQDIYTFKGKTYGVVAITPQIYLKSSKRRAKKIVNVSRKEFQKLVKPLSYYVPEIKYDSHKY